MNTFASLISFTFFGSFSISCFSHTNKQTNKLFFTDGDHPIFSEATGIDGLLRNDVKTGEEEEEKSFI